MLFASTTKGFLCLAVVTGLANTAHATTGQDYCPDECTPAGFANLEWTINAEDFATVTANDATVRIDFDDSNDCGGSSDGNAGFGQATATVDLDGPVDLDVSFSGVGESGFENLLIVINGQTVAYFTISGSCSAPLPVCTGSGGPLHECSNQIVTVPLAAGSNTIVVTGNTKDGVKHQDAYFAISFVPQGNDAETGPDCSTCNNEPAAPTAAPTAPPTAAPTAPPTAAPTPAPTPSFEWQQESGCCREKVGKSMYNHHATASDVQIFTQSTGYEAYLDCTATCASDTMCTAIELTVKEGIARCEFHTSTINAATRATNSCKKAQCKYKTAYMAPTAAPVAGPTPMVSPTSAPTAVPMPEPAWTEKKGCCRQVDGKFKARLHDTATTKIISATFFSAAAVECKELCNADANCTAAEVRQPRKKKTTVFKCELHSQTVNSSTTGSKSCKKATCSIKN